MNTYRLQRRTSASAVGLMQRVNTQEQRILVEVAGTPGPTGPGYFQDVWEGFIFDEGLLAADLRSTTRGGNNQPLVLWPFVQDTAFYLDAFSGIGLRTASTPGDIEDSAYFLIDWNVTGYGSAIVPVTSNDPRIPDATAQRNWCTSEVRVTQYSNRVAAWSRSVPINATPWDYTYRVNAGTFRYDVTTQYYHAIAYGEHFLSGPPMSVFFCGWSNSRSEWVVVLTATSPKPDGSDLDRHYWRMSLTSNATYFLNPADGDVLPTSDHTDILSHNTGATSAGFLTSQLVVGDEMLRVDPIPFFFYANPQPGYPPPIGLTDPRHGARVRYLERDEVVTPPVILEPYPLTEWDKFLRDQTRESIGTFPPLEALTYTELPPADTDALVCPDTITQIRDAIEDIAEYFENPGTGNPYNWTDASADNLYFVACGDRTQFGAQGGARYTWTRSAAGMLGTPTFDIDIAEIDACVTQLEGSALV